MQWPLLSGCRLGTGAIRRLISGHCCHWPVVPSTPRRSLRNTALVNGSRYGFTALDKRQDAIPDAGSLREPFGLLPIPGRR